MPSSPSRIRSSTTVGNELLALPAIALATVVLMSCEYEGSTEPTAVEMPGGAGLESQQEAIIGGWVDNGHPAVGAVVSWGHLCTGTLISPKVVLTAAHCLLPGDPPKNFGLGPSTTQSTAVYNIVQAIPHGQFGQTVVDNAVVQVHDIAILVLDKPATVTPMKFRVASINGMDGTGITFVGYGQSQVGNPNSVGTKMYVGSSMGDVNSYGFWNFTNQSNPKNTCGGDSGGPGILSSGGVDEVVGVVSAGDEYCVQNGWNTRVDIHADWIAGLVQQYDPTGIPPAVCGNGACEAGESAASCPADCQGSQTGIGTPCNSSNDCDSPMVCVTAGAESYCTQFCADPNGGSGCPQGFTCVPLKEPPPSGEGVCAKGSSTGTCGNGTCDAGEGTSNCPADCQGGGCGAISFEGCCDGEMLRYCENGSLQQINCAGSPSCGWNSQASFYDCGTDGSGDPSNAHPKACGTAPPQPVCGNGTCEAGENKTNCPADCSTTAGCGDGVCGQGENFQSCASDCSAAACGEVTYEGCCSGELLEYCEQGKLQMIHCGGNPSCGWNTEGKYYDCGTTGGADPTGASPAACPGPPAPVCGDGTCQAGETSSSCPQDCGAAPTCGNDTCEAGETAASCAADCEEARTCGNGTCDAGETAASCAPDCEAARTCGNGTCDAGETEESCPADCKQGAPQCGDGTCEAGEDCHGCPEDCGFCVEDEDGGGGGGTCATSPAAPASDAGALLLVLTAVLLTAAARTLRTVAVRRGGDGALPCQRQRRSCRGA